MKLLFLLLILPSILLSSDKNKTYATISLSSLQKSSLPQSLKVSWLTPEVLVKTSMGLVKLDELDYDKAVGLCLSLRENKTGYPSGIYFIPLKKGTKVSYEKRLATNATIKSEGDMLVVNDILGIRQVNDYLLFGLDPISIKDFDITYVDKLFAETKAKMKVNIDVTPFSESEKSNAGNFIAFGEKIDVEGFFDKKSLSFNIKTSLDLRGGNGRSFKPLANKTNLNFSLPKTKLLHIINSFSGMNPIAVKMLKEVLGDSFMLSQDSESIFLALASSNSSEAKALLVPLVTALNKSMKISEENGLLIFTLSKQNKVETPKYEFSEKKETFIKGELNITQLRSFFPALPSEFKSLDIQLKATKTLEAQLILNLEAK
jgi:hypothetical protein